jgi:hypothetical protein
VGLILPLALILCSLLCMHGRWRFSPPLLLIVMTLNAALFVYISYRAHLGVYGELLTGLLVSGPAVQIIRMPRRKVGQK